MPAWTPLLDHFSVTCLHKDSATYICVNFRQTESSFVSLRDVNRLLKVMMWFYDRAKVIFPLMDKQATEELVRQGFEVVRAEQLYKVS